MRAGRLRKLVTIEAVTETQNARGEPIQTWAPEAVVWASIEPLSGREFVTAQQRVSDVTHQVGLRYRPGLTPKKRLNMAGRIFNILTTLNVGERNRSLELLVKEVL